MKTIPGMAFHPYDPYTRNAGAGQHTVKLCSAKEKPDRHTLVSMQTSPVNSVDLDKLKQAITGQLLLCSTPSGSGSCSSLFR